LLNDSLNSEAGVDGRGFWPLRQDTILAVHLALRYLLHANDAPFWALSSIGGGRSDIGAEQPRVVSEPDGSLTGIPSR